MAELYTRRAQGSVALYSAEQVRALDRAATEVYGIAGIVLMKRAAAAALQEIRTFFADGARRPLLVVCGGGNNGGDGYVLAGLAAQGGQPVEVVAMTAAEGLQGDAARARAFAVESGVTVCAAAALGGRLAAATAETIVVDALLGIGLRGAPREEAQAAIGAINDSGLEVAALDVPSGLSADSGGVAAAAVRARLTVTFVGRKRGLYTGGAAEFAGQVRYADLGLPTELFASVSAVADLLDLHEREALLAGRRPDAHKGDFGHVLVVGGDDGMGGAVCMAAEAALRAGAGLVSAATRPRHVPALLARLPEVMAAGVESGLDVAPLIDRCDVLVIGPGLGRGSFAEQLLACALAAAAQRPELVVVLDADALNGLAAIAGRGDEVPRPSVAGRWVMTPHPGEASRLLGRAVSSVQADRFGAVAALRERFAATAVLKGNGTLVAGYASGADGLSGEASIGVCPFGNPGMASGGMGDVLCGLIGGAAAQLDDPLAATRLAVAVHGAAADRVVAEMGMPGLIATDLIPVAARLLGGVIGVADGGPVDV